MKPIYMEISIKQEHDNLPNSFMEINKYLRDTFCNSFNPMQDTKETESMFEDTLRSISRNFANRRIIDFNHIDDFTDFLRSITKLS